MDDSTARRRRGARRRRDRHETYDPRAYGLVAESLSVALAHLSEHRHLSARECADGVLALAAARFGVLGDTVLEGWGVHTSEDIGRIIAQLADRGLVSLSDEDRIDDFTGLFRVDEDFVARYRIGEGLRARSAGRPRGQR